MTKQHGLFVQTPTTGTPVRLQEDEDGFIDLVADVNGETVFIVGISPEGELLRYAGAREIPGLKLRTNGEIKLFDADDE